MKIKISDGQIGIELAENKHLVIFEIDDLIVVQENTQIKPDERSIKTIAVFNKTKDGSVEVVKCSLKVGSGFSIDASGRLFVNNEN